MIMQGYKLQDTVHVVMITMGSTEMQLNLNVMIPVLGMQIKYVEDILDKASTTQVSLYSESKYSVELLSRRYLYNCLSYTH